MSPLLLPYPRDKAMSYHNHCVYIIGYKPGQPVKIGITRNPASRIKQLQTAAPYQLQILALIPNVDYETEKFIHNNLSRHRLKGEWFEWCEYIQELCISFYPSYLRYCNETDLAEEVEELLAETTASVTRDKE